MTVPLAFWVMFREPRKGRDLSHHSLFLWLWLPMICNARFGIEFQLNFHAYCFGWIYRMSWHFMMKHENENSILIWKKKLQSSIVVARKLILSGIPASVVLFGFIISALTILWDWSMWLQNNSSGLLKEWLRIHYDISTFHPWHLRNSL